MPIELGQILDNKYRVVRRIGEGGMGTVYEGLNVRIDRRVAIKVLHEQVASLPEFAQRFEREARAAARIGSPHVCDVLDLGDLENGERYIVMEFLEGMSLEDRISAGTMTPDELAPIAFEILEGLGTMHHAGVIHRDLKPANVFLARMPNRRREIVKILDFGIAKIQPLANDPAQMTSTGMMMGTPLYMSPEQAKGAREVDGRSDLYSASVIFYRALTGELPYTAANLNELLFKIVLEEPRAIRELRPELEEAFSGIVMKGLTRDRDQRYASAREYQEAIAEWGRARGRSSLAFTISLPSAPPPAPVASGPVTPVTPAGAGPGGTVALPSQTPASVAAKSHPKLESGGTLKAADISRPSAGTPVAWSGNPHAIAASASDPPAAAASAMALERTSAAPPTPPPAPAPAAVQAAPAKRPASRTPLFAAAAGVALVAIGGAALGTRKGDDVKTTASSSAESVVSAPPSEAPVVAPPSTVASASPSATESATASSAEPTADAHVAKAPPAPTTKRGAAGTASASAGAPRASAAPTASASPASSAPATPPSGKRKFRTDLD